MKPIPVESRRKNRGLFVERPRNSTRQALGAESCHTCADSGFVVVLRRPAERLSIRPGCVCDGAYEELGPCPFCQAGFAVEFPVPTDGDRGGPWGADGYWRGRDSAELEQMYRQSPAPLSLTENRRRWRELIGPLFGRVAGSLEAEAA